MYWVATRPTGVLEESSISFLVIGAVRHRAVRDGDEGEVACGDLVAGADGLRGCNDFGGAGERFCDSVVGVDLRYDATPPAMTAMTARPAVTFCRRETFTAIFSMPVRLGPLGDAAPRRRLPSLGLSLALASSLAFCFSALRSARDWLRGLGRLLALLFRFLFLSRFSRFRIGKEAGGFHLVDRDVLVGLLRGIIWTGRCLMVRRLRLGLGCGGILRRKRGSRVGCRLAIRIHGRGGLVVDRMRLGCRCSRDICRRLIGSRVLHCRCLRVLRNRLLRLLGNRIGRRVRHMPASAGTCG